MTRPRSNALAGPSDPRFRSPAEVDLYVKAKIPLAVALDLDEFLKKVFARRDLMETVTDPDRISKELYGMYTEGEAHALSNETALQSARNVWWKFSKGLPRELFSKAFFQYEKFQNEKCLLNNQAIFDDDALARRLITDFLYFPIKSGNTTYRVYLNVTFESMPDVVMTVLSLPRANLDEIVALKTVGPGAGRTDTVVIYCTTLEGAHGVAVQMLAAIQDGRLVSTDQSTPGMTKRIGPGVSVGAEPAWQETGLEEHIPGYPTTAQSFGTIRSQVIAAAILNYRANTTVLGTGYPVFRQLAAVAFKGYGLNPAAPEL